MMKTFFRIALRVVFLLIVAALLGIGGTMAWFRSWRTEKLSHLNAASTVAETAAGKIEFVQTGEGPVVLVFHGSPGGFDQAMLYGSALSEAGFRIVAPSRPGYLQTPLSTGLTPENQADAMVSLLDSLDIRSVAVIGISLGSPAAIEFARRHPDRTWALVLLSAVTKKIPASPLNPPIPEVLNKGLSGDMGAWALVETSDSDPAKALCWAFDLAQTGDSAERGAWVGAVLEKPAQIAWFRDLVGTTAPLSPRETGLRNDLLQLRVLADVPYEKLGVPSLFVHGVADKWLPLADVEAVVKRMPQAELLAVPATGHLVELGPNSAPVMEKIIGFLNRFHGGQGAP
ncbi:MAG: alpha/beta hydrolase [Verrucomicrobiae bacterium]